MTTFETAAAAMIEAHTMRAEAARDLAQSLGAAVARFSSWWKGLVTRTPQDGIHLG